MNTAFLSGTIANAGNVKVSGKGNKYIEFSIRSKRNSKSSEDFKYDVISIFAFGYVADYVEKNIAEGDYVQVLAEINTKILTSASTGKKSVKVNFIATDIENIRREEMTAKELFYETVENDRYIDPTTAVGRNIEDMLVYRDKVKEFKENNK